jgi:hypothetical protein
MKSDNQISPYQKKRLDEIVKRKLDEVGWDDHYIPPDKKHTRMQFDEVDIRYKKAK